MRYDPIEKKLILKQEATKEDQDLRLKGESVDAKMVRILLPALNNINADLNFTSEIMEDFEDRRLPTLDFKMWLEKDQEINHTYFEKEMRTQLVIPRRSSIPERQKMNILSNEGNRRISNVNMERLSLIHI